MGSSPPSSTSSLFTSLPARPPTPPRDVANHVDNALHFLEHGHDAAAAPVDDTTASTALVKSRLARVASSTAADTTPLKATASPQQRGSGSAKKVDFSPWPVYHKIPHIGQSSSPVTQTNGPLNRPSPLARQGKPLKSILKATTNADGLPPTPEDTDLLTNYFSPADPSSFRKMLQSVLQQLDSSSRDARRDAYMVMNNYMKAHAMAAEDLTILDEKMARFTQFLSRDMAWRDSNGSLDTALAVPASLLTCAFLFHPRIQTMFDDDFRAFIVDRSMFVLEQTDLPKAVVRAHLQMLCVQRFGPSIVNPARTEKLLNITHTLEDRPSVAAAKLIILQRLVETAPATMLSKMTEWIEHLFHGALSNVPDVQRRAIDAFTQVGMILGTHHTAAKVIHEVCEREMEEGQSFGDYFNMQLIQMTAEPDRAHLVPEIWTAVVLCFRTKRRPVTVWPKLKNWLLTLQKCLNTSDIAVKRPANIAWNKLVYTVHPDSSTTETMRSMLKVPIVAGLERRGNNEQAQQLRQIALDSYCNLLHYGLRPELSHEELDVAWDMYVGSVLNLISKNSTKGRQTACRILHGLLKKTSGAWNKDAAIEAVPIRPDELPRLDVRWVRSRVGKFIKLIEPMIVATMLSPFEANRAIDGSWRLLMRAIAEAGSQEVRTSNELKEVIAQVTNLFRRLWAAAVQLGPGTDVQVWISRYQSLLEITVDGVGSNHFVEEILAKTNTDDIEAAPTPSHRKRHAMTCSPFVVLFALYHQPPPVMVGSSTCKASATWFLKLLGIAKGSTSGILGLLHKALQYCAPFRVQTLRAIHAELWNAVAETAIGALKSQALLSPQRDTSVAGNVLKAVINILADGVECFNASTDSSRRLVELYAAAHEFAKQAAGEGGAALGLMEPFAESLKERSENTPLPTLLALVTSMLNIGAWPKNRADLDRSRKALWSVSIEVPRPQVFDPFEALYLLLLSILDRSYTEVANCEISIHDDIADTAIAMVGFLQKCPATILPGALRKLSDGFVTWVQDKQRVLYPASDSVSEELQALQTRVNELWTMLLILIHDGFAQKDTRALDSLEPILLAGFLSPSKHIVNSMITFWNKTFAKDENLKYPPTLFPILRARQMQTEIELPRYPKPPKKDKAIGLPAFAESQLPIPVRGSLTSTQRVTPKAKRQAPQDNIFIRQHLAAQGLPHATSESTKTTLPAARPRHDDSQVHFAPIAPQVRADAVESQHLTEHQLDVRVRQQHDAALYPDLSSSPPEPAAKGVSKKLDFMTTQARTHTGDVTPTTPVDGHPMSDDFPSSPTPRASARQTLSETHTDHADRPEDGISTRDEQPPSAVEDGPEVPEDQMIDDATVVIDDTTVVDNTTAVDITAATERDQDDETEPPVEDASEQDAALQPREGIGSVDLPSELPSDTLLPNAQLEREQQAAAALKAEPTEVSKAAFPTSPEVTQTEIPATPSRSSSRVEAESIQADEHTTTPSDAGTTDSRSSRASKKRKRSSETVFTARKKPPQSPFNRFMSRIFKHGSQEEELEDEIVVASQTVSPPREGKEVVKPSSEIESEDHVELAEEAQPVKRRSGRPKKSDSQSQALSQDSIPSISTRGLKRRASAQSLASSQDNRSTASPAPGKAKRLRQSTADDASSVASQSSQHGRFSRRTTRSQADEDELSVVADSQQQPHSILAQLRGILSSAKSMILGSREEEREFDDVLFEIRREVFEAGKRRDERDGQD